MQRRPWNAIKLLLILGLALALPLSLTSCAKGKQGISPAAKAGKKIFESNCALCHIATSTQTKIGPGLKGLLKRKELPYSHRPATVANVREQIEDGSPKVKPVPMPAFGSKLSAAQINDVIAYLKTL